MVAEAPGLGRAAINPWLENRLSALAMDGPILDLGCGRGSWLRRMGVAGLAAVGIEEEQPRVAEAHAHAPVARADAARLPLADASVRLVWCIHVLHHVGDPAVVLSEVRRVLASGGHLILAETVEDHPVVRIGRRIWPRWDGVPVRSRFRAADLLAMLPSAGLEVVDSRLHSLVSFAAWTLPVRAEQAWTALSRLEERLPARFNRFGAHLECVARAR